MMDSGSNQDIRWKQRYENFKAAFAQLAAAVELADQRTLSNLEQQGLIQAFEYTHELAWNVMKDYLEYQGVFNLLGSRDVSRAAYKHGLVQDGEAWMDMIKARNLSSHTYSQNIAEAIVADILSRFFPAMINLNDTLTKIETEPNQ